MTKLIELTSRTWVNAYAAVDDNDYEWLSGYEWRCMSSDGEHFYAAFSKRDDTGRKTILMHRLLADAPTGAVVDHRDGNGLNNTKRNLRVCSHANNMRNTKSRKGTSIYKGVSWRQDMHKWAAQISNNDAWFAIGYFDTEDQAALAYDAKALELFGEYAFLNFVEPNLETVDIPKPIRESELVCRPFIYLSGKHGRGKVVTIDDDDYEWINSYSWYVCASSDAPDYAATTGERGKTVLMHRLMMDAQPGEIVDHINGDGLDNRRSNLRICTPLQNGRNSKGVNKTSAYKGVYAARHGKPWVATIKVNGRTIHLGKFLNEIDAASAYDSAAKHHFGEFARLNFSGE